MAPVRPLSLKRHHRLALVALGVLLLLAANGRWIVPIAAWVAPVPLMLVICDSARRWILAAWVAVVIATTISWYGMVPIHGAMYFAGAVVLGTLWFVPYLAHRMAQRRHAGILHTTVYPLALVTIELVASRISPAGSWGSLAYTQSDHLALVQLAALTGTAGITFLVAWTSAMLATIVGAPTAHKGKAWLLAVVLGTIITSGQLRLVPRRDVKVIRVAAIAVPRGRSSEAYALLGARADDPKWAALRPSMLALQDSLFLHSDIEARAGAELIVWSELNAFVLKQDEAALLTRARAFATAAKVTLAIPMAVFTPGDLRMENTLTLVGTLGKTVSYHKRNPVPGDPERGGGGDLPLLATRTKSAVSSIAGAICFDADWPALVSTVARDADILVVPASDWSEIDPLHTRMAVFRGVENGVSVIRSTRLGLSIVADPFGRTLASADYFRKTPSIVVGDVPMLRTWTPYAEIGDVFAWMCVLALGGVGLMTLRYRRNHPEGIT